MDDDLSLKELRELVFYSVLISVGMLIVQMSFRYLFKYLLTQI
jgi:hypothetical protein